MAVANIFNASDDGVSTSLPVLQGIAGRTWRIRQLNIQNRNEDDSVNVLITDDADTPNTIIGPILIAAGQLLSVELASEEHQHMLILEKGSGLEVAVDGAADLTVFGFAGLT